MRTSVPTIPFKKAEGDYRDGPWLLPLTGGWLPANAGWNFWQQGLDPVSGYGRSAMVEACVGAYSQTMAMCPGDHWRKNAKNGRDRITNSALCRILRSPNSYQTISDFMLNLTRNLYSEGEGFALALRNDRFEISELHLMSSRLSGARVAVTGDVFYELAGNEIIDRQVNGRLLVPARDVLHVRLHTPRHPLQGESPMTAVALDIAATDAMVRQQLMFFINQARPSTVLATDLILTKEQVDELRVRWDTQSKGLGTGGTPILTAGLKPTGMPMSSARDAQLADIMKMTEQHIALAFRMPLQILGIGGTPFASTEALMQSWIATGFGFTLNHIEEAFGKLFKLTGQPDEYLEFNTAAILRSALKDRIEAYAMSTKSGLFTPNEARAEFEKDEVEGGDEVRMQQQDVPLSYGAELEPPKPAPAAAPAGSDPADPGDGEDPENDKQRVDSFRRTLRRAQAGHIAG